jgi:hypothetical protein
LGRRTIAGSTCRSISFKCGLSVESNSLQTKRRTPRMRFGELGPAAIVEATRMNEVATGDETMQIRPSHIVAISLAAVRHRLNGGKDFAKL